MCVEGGTPSPQNGEENGSVTKTMRQGNDVWFTAEDMMCTISNKGNVIGRAHLEGELWVLDCSSPRHPHSSFLAKKVDDLNLWHQRFGHLGVENLKRLRKEGMVKDYSPTGEELAD